MNEEILKRIDTLATKLGTTAEYLWGVLIKQAHVVIWQDVIVIFICSVCVSLCVWGLFWSFGKDDEGYKRLSYKSDCEDRALLIALLSGTLLAISTPILVVEALDLMSVCVNPEYWALKEILNNV